MTTIDTAMDLFLQPFQILVDILVGMITKIKHQMLQIKATIMISVNSVNAVLYIEWTDEDQYGTGGNVLNADVTGITFGYYNGSDWDVTYFINYRISISNGIVTSNAFNFAGQYVTLGSLDGENNLPIDLVSFEGECIDNQANLEFVVASQVNNEYFTIERSKNLLSWEKLGDLVEEEPITKKLLIITKIFLQILVITTINYHKQT